MAYLRYYTAFVIGVLAVTLAWFAGYYNRDAQRDIPRMAMLYSHSYGPRNMGISIEEILTFDMVANGALPPVHLEHVHVDNSNITAVVSTLYRHGVKSFVGLLLSSSLDKLEPFAKSHPDALFYSTASTAGRFSNVANMIRLATPDTRTRQAWQHLANSTMKDRDVVVAYTAGDVWSVDLANMLVESLGDFVHSISKVEDVYISSLEFTGQFLISLTNDVDTFLMQHMSHAWLAADIIFGDGAAYVSLPDVPQWRNSTNLKAFVVANNARDVSHLPTTLLKSSVSPYVSELVRALQIATTVEYLRKDGAFHQGFSIQTMYGIEATNMFDTNNDRNQVYFELGRFHVYENPAAVNSSQDGGRRLISARGPDDWSLEDHELQWFIGNGKYARRTCADAARVIVEENDGITWLEDVSISDATLRREREEECINVREWARYYLMATQKNVIHLSPTETLSYYSSQLPPGEWHPYLWFGEFYNWDSCTEIAHYRARRGDSSPYADNSYNDRRRVFESQCNAARNEFSSRFVKLVHRMKQVYNV